MRDTENKNFKLLDLMPWSVWDSKANANYVWKLHPCSVDEQPIWNENVRWDCLAQGLMGKASPLIWMKSPVPWPGSVKEVTVRGFVHKLNSMRDN